MPHRIEPATTGRAKCRACGEKIASGSLRFGESLPNPFAEGETQQWFHLECGAYRRPEPFLEALSQRTEPLDDGARLAAEAQQGVAQQRLPRLAAADRAPTGRAQCRQCREPIAKDAWRVGLVFWEDGRFSAAGFVHARCAPAYFETGDLVGRVRRFTPALAEADLAQIEGELKAGAGTRSVE